MIINLLLLRYNNKTYRIDDIDWEKNPNDKFKTFDGSEISFIDYYKKVSSTTKVNHFSVISRYSSL